MYKSKGPKKESNRPEEDNRLIELADEELDSVTGGNGYGDDDDALTVDGMDTDFSHRTSPEYKCLLSEQDNPDDMLQHNLW